MPLKTKIIDGIQLTRYKTSLGNYWVPDEPKTDEIGNSIKNGLLYDDFVFNMLSPYFNNDKVLLDIGSNLGQMAIEFSRHVHTVHAFEANPFLYKVLCLNIKENNIKNIIPHFCAVWDSSDKVLTYEKPNFKKFKSRGSFGIDPNNLDVEGNFPVQSLSIDSLNLPKVDIVKIDIQGSDLRAMLGMLETIKNHKPIIVYEYESILAVHFKENIKDYENFEKKINYTRIEMQRDNYLIKPNET